jgi:hypothetical protein
MLRKPGGISRLIIALLSQYSSSSIHNRLYITLLQKNLDGYVIKDLKLADVDIRPGMVHRQVTAISEFFSIEKKIYTVLDSLLDLDSPISLQEIPIITLKEAFASRTPLWLLIHATRPRFCMT